MSFIGNIAAAESAKAIGKYNSSVAYEEAQYARKKAAIREKVYDTVERPRFLDQQDQKFADFFVRSLKSGAEMRAGTTPMFVAIKNKQLQSFDLAVADYNTKVGVTDMINQSLLIEARGRGEEFKGRMTARTEMFKAAGSLLSMGSQSYNQGRLVIV
jgi:hypothetical protein